MRSGPLQLFLGAAAVSLAVSGCKPVQADTAQKAAPPAAAPAPAAPEPLETAADAPLGTSAALPPDVEAQRENAETCEHFAGEEPYDEARRREIEAAIDASCRPLHAALPALWTRHQDDPAVMATLTQWQELANGIE